MTDPIVDEVRAARAKIMARCGNDLDKLVKYLERKRKRQGLKAVRLYPQRMSDDVAVHGKDRHRAGKTDLSALKAPPAHPATGKRKAV